MSLIYSVVKCELRAEAKKKRLVDPDDVARALLSWAVSVFYLVYFINPEKGCVYS